MATKDSKELKSDERYPLGDYSFRIERSSVPGSTNDKIEAICTDKDGKNARKSIQLPSSTQLNGWYVEANETEATVYAIVHIPESSPLPPGVTIPATTSLLGTYKRVSNTNSDYWEYGVSGLNMSYFCPWESLRTVCGVLHSKTPIESISYTNHEVRNHYNGALETREVVRTTSIKRDYTYNDKTVYFEIIYLHSWDVGGMIIIPPAASYYEDRRVDIGPIAWDAEYGSHETDEEKEVIVGRFAIEIEDAGGVGPGSDWSDPGDYDPDWEPEDPTHTLYVTVTGALSGRHNDPIEDPSYSYIPSDKDTVKDYGYGGDGGHGGGGGAGASTVVIHKFATNQANSKEVTAIARRHGYGSGGGKGGKGGDGCILVYY